MAYCSILHFPGQPVFYRSFSSTRAFLFRLTRKGLVPPGAWLGRSLWLLFPHRPCWIRLGIFEDCYQIQKVWSFEVISCHYISLPKFTVHLSNSKTYGNCLTRSCQQVDVDLLFSCSNRNGFPSNTCQQKQVASLDGTHVAPVWGTSWNAEAE